MQNTTIDIRQALETFYDLFALSTILLQDSIKISHKFSYY